MTSGITLAGSYFEAEVRPLVEQAFPSLGYVAARLGSGSDVLGFDDERSHDHDFGCRLTVLVDTPDADVVPRLDEMLEHELPTAFEGRQTRFATSWDARIRHKVEVSTVDAFAKSRLGFDAVAGLDAIEWLCLTGQSVLEVVGGAVFHDSTPSYRRLQERLAWYPDDVWRYVLAAGWSRLGQELPFVGRTAERGDDIGPSVIAARLARDVMHLAFIVHRTWSPYPKWTGSALATLPDGRALTDALRDATSADHWQQQEAALCDAIAIVGAAHRTAGFVLDDPLVEPFFDRPFRITSPAIVDAIRLSITDPDVRALPAGIGSIEQWCDNVDVLSHPARRRQVEAVYRQLIAGDIR